jgi:hypothetical protein
MHRASLPSSRRTARVSALSLPVTLQPNTFVGMNMFATRRYADEKPGIPDMSRIYPGSSPMKAFRIVRMQALAAVIFATLTAREQRVTAMVASIAMIVTTIIISTSVNPLQKHFGYLEFI